MKQDIFSSCLAKQKALKDSLGSSPSPEAMYEALIRQGKSLPPFAPHLKTPEHIVAGCQSIVYLHATLQDGAVLFTAASESLISAGLAALLIAIYSGESPETLLTCPPAVLEELNIAASLSANRSNGLASIYLRMKQEALKFFVSSKALEN